MNRTKQFWTLLKYQAIINPFILLMPCIFWFSFHWNNNHHTSLYMLLYSPSIMFVAIIGMLYLAPEIFSNTNTAQYGSIEFLLTRAVDRPLVYRARVAFCYLLFLLMLLPNLLGAFKNPSVIIDAYDTAAYQQILHSIPGSIAMPVNHYGKSTEIMIPNGNLLAESWRLCEFAVAIMAMQILILLIQPLKYRRWIFWGLYIGFILAPLSSLISTGKKWSLAEESFLLYAPYSIPICVGLMLVLLCAQYGCEYLFRRLEH